MFFDTHAHLNDDAFQEDYEAVLNRCIEARVTSLVNVGFDMPSSIKAVDLANKYTNCYAAIGVHPHDATTVTEETYNKLRELANNPKVVAIGEIGLDYYRDLSPRDLQKEIFINQIALARELNLPITIHDRDAHGDLMHILREKAKGVTGILHCFSGSWEMAKVCLDLGFYISFAGPITFKNSRNLPEVAEKVPLDRILIETDCPYLTPEPYRGKRNEPTYVVQVAKKIANIKNIPLEEIGKATTDNAKRIFNIK